MGLPNVALLTACGVAVVLGGCSRLQSREPEPVAPAPAHVSAHVRQTHGSTPPDSPSRPRNPPRAPKKKPATDGCGTVRTPGGRSSHVVVSGDGAGCAEAQRRAEELRARIDRGETGQVVRGLVQDWLCESGGPGGTACDTPDKNVR